MFLRFSVWKSPFVLTLCFLFYLTQMSILNHFSRNGKMTIKDWREFTRTFSGMYCLQLVVYVLAVSSLRLQNSCHLSLMTLQVVVCSNSMHQEKLSPMKGLLPLIRVMCALKFGAMLMSAARLSSSG